MTCHQTTICKWTKVEKQIQYDKKPIMFVKNEKQLNI